MKTVWIKNIVLFFIGAFLTLICLEVFLHFSKLSTSGFNKYYDDIGYGLPKSKKLLFFNEGLGIMETNEHRFLGDSPLEKDSATIRIALIGDSFIEGRQVFSRNHFGELFKQQLVKRFPNKNIEVFNFGRTGFGLKEMYAYDKVFVDSFQVDYKLYFLAQRDFETGQSASIQFMPTARLNSEKLPVSIEYQSPLSAHRPDQLHQFLRDYSITAGMLNNGLKKTEELGLKEVILRRNNHDEQDRPARRSYKYKLPLDPLVYNILSSIGPKAILIKRDTVTLPNVLLAAYEKNLITHWDLGPLIQPMYDNGHAPNWWKITRKIGHWNNEAHLALSLYLSNLMIEKLEEDLGYK